MGREGVRVAMEALNSDLELKMKIIGWSWNSKSEPHHLQIWRNANLKLEIEIYDWRCS